MRKTSIPSRYSSFLGLTAGGIALAMGKLGKPRMERSLVGGKSLFNVPSNGEIQLERDHLYYSILHKVNIDYPDNDASCFANAVTR